MTYLNLSENDIADVTPLAGLTNLEKLDINGNEIGDISPLVENCRSSYGGPSIHYSLKDNPLSPESIEICMPALREKGVQLQ